MESTSTICIQDQSKIKRNERFSFTLRPKKNKIAINQLPSINSWVISYPRKTHYHLMHKFPDLDVVISLLSLSVKLWHWPLDSFIILWVSGICLPPPLPSQTEHTHILSHIHISFMCMVPLFMCTCHLFADWIWTPPLFVRQHAHKHSPNMHTDACMHACIVEWNILLHSYILHACQLTVGKSTDSLPLKHAHKHSCPLVTPQSDREHFHS